MSKQRLTLAERFRFEFDSSVRKRGEAYFKEGRVLQQFLEPLCWIYKVRGSGGAYLTTLERKSARADGIVGQCSCPHFLDGFFCKHLWAVILDLDSKNYWRKFDGDVLIHGDDFEEVWDDEDFDEDDDFEPYERPLAALTSWKTGIGALRTLSQRANPPSTDHSSRKERLGYYHLDVEEFEKNEKASLVFSYREKLKNGEWGALKKASLHSYDFILYRDPLDEEVLRCVQAFEPSYTRSFNKKNLPEFVLFPLLEKLSKAGRLFDRDPVVFGEEKARPLPVEFSEPWRLECEVIEKGKEFRLGGRLVLDSESVPIDEPRSITKEGLIVFSDRLARLGNREHLSWVSPLRERLIDPIPESEIGQFIAMLGDDSDGFFPPVLLPERLRIETRVAPPNPRVVFSADTLRIERIDFLYGEAASPASSESKRVYDAKSGCFYERDREMESRSIDFLASLLPGALVSESVSVSVSSDRPIRLPQSSFTTIAQSLIEAGWRVEIDGRLIRSGQGFQATIHSGMDWFDLEGGVSFSGGMSLTLPALLAAEKSNSKTVILDDGSVGILPEEYLRREAVLRSLVETKEGTARVHAKKGIFLGAAFNQDPLVRGDEGFKRWAKAASKGFPKLAPSRSFKATLRPYQSEGLRWLGFLKQNGIGGILADDMGLGKTVQILALIERYAEKGKPSLVVVPKSLLYNWKEESERFSPKLRVGIYEGKERSAILERLDEFDVVLVSYPILRIDFDRFSELRFHFLVLDEANAIKNPTSLSFQCSSAIQADHRIAMTGTPIENGVQDLVSLVDFTNPGLLGTTARRALLGEDSEARSSLLKALSPLILRRRKEDVLKELPEKTEQVLHCELSPAESREYARVRNHFREKIAKRVESFGWNQSKIHVLEALLRLRQIACHPALIDPKRAGAGSAKMDLLIERLLELESEGRQSLVFSQFTALLDLVESRLKKNRIAYERIDGKTPSRARARIVSRFQGDSVDGKDGPKVLLISLKAGGVGLNLTSAEYVFILDPWWNPAAEAQAIDRAHRIGQTKRVMAYRLIAKGTIEEKVLELQQKKRGIAELIGKGDESALKAMSESDLNLLLS